MLSKSYLLLFLLLLSQFVFAQRDEMILKKVNEVRQTGCKCGQLKMQATQALVWNDQLEYSALLHARDMKKYNFFGHHSKDGKDVGTRVEAIGYKWLVIGENLGEGQKTFEEVLQDWIKSPSHCEMLMNPKVTEMGVAKYDRFWVQHFGKPADSSQKVKRHVQRRQRN